MSNEQLTIEESIDELDTKIFNLNKKIDGIETYLNSQITELQLDDLNDDTINVLYKNIIRIDDLEQELDSINKKLNKVIDSQKDIKKLTEIVKYLAKSMSDLDGISTGNMVDFSNVVNKINHELL